MKPTSKKLVDPVFKGLCLLVSGIGVGWLIGLSVSPVVHIVITSLIAFVVSVTSALAGLKVDQDGNQTVDKTPPKRRLRVEVNPVPMMLVVVGLALGASLGVYSRANGWLGPRASVFAQQWKETGLDQKEISRRLFDTLYPPRGETSPPIEQADRGTNTGQANSSSSPEAESPSSNQSSTVSLTKSHSSTTKPAPRTQRSQETGNTPGLPMQYFAGVLFSSPSPSDCDRFMTARDERLSEYLTNYKDTKVVEAAGRCGESLVCLKALVNRLCTKKR